MMQPILFQKHSFRARAACLLCTLGLFLVCCLEKHSGGMGMLFDFRPPVRYTFSRPEGTASFAEKRAAVEEALAVIHEARFELRIWCYGFDEPELIAALAEARARSVDIRLIGSEDQSYDELKREGFLPEIRIRTGLQHAKLIVADRSMLFTGTGNFTTSDLFRSNNAFITMKITPEVAEEVVALFDSENVHAFHAPVSSTGVRLIPGPALGRGIQLLIIASILEAKHTVRYLIFSHTDPLITAALALQASRGIAIEGIYDDESESGALPKEAARWNAALGPRPVVLYLEGNRMGIPSESGFRSGGKLHHKTLIIDDQRVLMGSFNWSQSARDRNMEILLDIRDPIAAGEFLTEFERVRAHAAPVGRNVQVSGPPPSTTISNGEVCSEGGGRVTLVGGRGTHTRAQDFQVTAGCVDLATVEGARAGIPGLTFADGAPALLLDLQPLRFAAQDSLLPCADAMQCASIELQNAAPKAGLLVLPETGDTAGQITGVVMVTSNGWWDHGPPAVVGARTIRTEPWKGDALFFLTIRGGLTLVACARSGLELDSGLDGWLKTFVAFGGTRPHCTSDG